MRKLKPSGVVTNRTSSGSSFSERKKLRNESTKITKYLHMQQDVSHPLKYVALCIAKSRQATVTSCHTFLACCHFLYEDCAWRTTTRIKPALSICTGEGGKALIKSKIALPM